MVYIWEVYDPLICTDGMGVQDGVRLYTWTGRVTRHRDLLILGWVILAILGWTTKNGGEYQPNIDIPKMVKMTQLWI